MGDNLDSPARRNSLAAMSAGGLGLAGGVFSNIRVASAPAITGTLPVVDRLSVGVVTDSYHHLFLPSGKFGEVAVQRGLVGVGGRGQDPAGPRRRAGR